MKWGAEIIIFFEGRKYSDKEVSNNEVNHALKGLYFLRRVIKTAKQVKITVEVLPSKNPIACSSEVLCILSMCAATLHDIYLDHFSSFRMKKI